MLAQFALGAAFAALIAFVAYRAHALAPSGAIAAFVVGTLTFGSGGWPMTVVLLAFFIPSVALSRIGRARKKQLVDIGKGGARDAWQVLANGGVATVCAVLFVFAHAQAGALFGAFAGAYAAATADTWGTEIGTLAQRMPRSILTLRPLATGLSGGITLPGTLAEVAGAASIALIAITIVPAAIMPVQLQRLFFAVLIAGISGALVDSILGATLQELRSCPRCGRTCETNPHVCGTPTALIRGIRGFSNDLVNGGATLAGSAIAFLLSSH